MSVCLKVLASRLVQQPLKPLNLILRLPAIRMLSSENKFNLHPTAWQKRVLVIAKAFPSVDAVPSTIDYDKVYVPAWQVFQRKFRIYLFLSVVISGHVIGIYLFLYHRRRFWDDVQQRRDDGEI